MSVSINKTVLFGLIVAIGIIIILPYLFLIYLQSQYDIILHTFDFGNTNRLFQSTNNKIIMHSGHGFLAPNDELAVSFNFNNGYNEPVEVITTMFKQVGDQKTNLPLGDFFVARNNNDTQAYTFHVSSEGENDIYFVITLKNSTSHKFIQNLTTSIIPLTTESVSSKLQEQANTITFSTLIVSGIIGGATVYALLKTRQTSEKHTQKLQEANKLLEDQNEYLKEQNEFIQKQAIERNRPWVGETNKGFYIIKLYNDSNDFRFVEQWNKMSESEKTSFNCTKVNWKIPLKNFGKNPAVDAQGHIMIATNAVPLKEKFGEFGEKFAIMPNNEYDFIFPIDSKTSDTIQNLSVKTYLCFDIKYGSSHSTQEYRYGFTALMTGGTGYRIQKTWDEKSYETMGSILLDETNPES